MSALHLTEQNFKSEVLNSDLPVLVDFWAEWCGPCRAIAPVIEELSGELTGKMKVAKVNVDEQQEIAQQFNIMSIPTLLIFKKGEVVDQIVGAVPKEHLLKKIKPQIA